MVQTCACWNLGAIDELNLEQKVANWLGRRNKNLRHQSSFMDKVSPARRDWKRSRWTIACFSLKAVERSNKSYLMLINVY